jgi:hypothetical protein
MSGVRREAGHIDRGQCGEVGGGTMARFRFAVARALGACAILLCAAPLALGQAPPPPVADSVTIDLSHPANVIIPDQALGAAIDGMQRGEVKKILSPFNLEKMRSAGLRRVTYRTRPELGIEAWHWSEEGAWSDPSRRQGYWTSSDRPKRHPDVTWGYSLPRRGDSVDQANDKGYSRLDDGDPKSFWKSNPYLDRRFTHLSANRPQWVVVSFEEALPLDAMRIAWARPWARRFRIQFWQGRDEYDKAGRWVDFVHGAQVRASFAGDEVVRLSDAPVEARFVRLLLTKSSETGPAGSKDVRDRLGYAVAEIGLGVIDAKGVFVDAMRRGMTKEDQTQVNVSSTDPWHRAIDRDRDTEQPSLDLIFRSGLNGGMPLIVPVGVFYDTPANAAAEIRYVRSRRWPVRQVELGEEADGQFIEPEDYADVYIEVARRLRRIDPALQLGGPSMPGAATETWPDPEPGRSWIGRFVAYLATRKSLDELQFFSFEHYAFDDVCEPLGGMLRDETQLLDSILDKARAAGVPTSIPWIISEYGFSPFSGRAMSLVPSALFSADVVGHFLSRGGTTAFMFGYTPGSPSNQSFPCSGYGDMMLFEADDTGRSKWPMPMYFAEKMMMQDWGAPAGEAHQLFASNGAVKDDDGRPMVIAYSLRRKDGTLAVMLLNRDEAAVHQVQLILNGAGAGAPFPAGPAQVVQYSPAQYDWLDKGEESHPTKDEPPIRFSIGTGPVMLPAMSLTVVTAAAPS